MMEEPCGRDAQQHDDSLVEDGADGAVLSGAVAASDEDLRTDAEAEADHVEHEVVDAGDG